MPLLRSGERHDAEVRDEDRRDDDSAIEARTLTSCGGPPHSAAKLLGDEGLGRTHLGTGAVLCHPGNVLFLDRLRVQLSCFSGQRVSALLSRG